MYGLQTSMTFYLRSNGQSFCAWQRLLWKSSWLLTTLSMSMCYLHSYGLRCEMRSYTSMYTMCRLSHPHDLQSKTYFVIGSVQGHTFVIKYHSFNRKVCPSISSITWVNACQKNNRPHLVRKKMFESAWDDLLFGDDLVCTYLLVKFQKTLGIQNLISSLHILQYINLQSI